MAKWSTGSAQEILNVILDDMYVRGIGVGIPTGFMSYVNDEPGVKDITKEVNEINKKPKELER